MLTTADFLNATKWVGILTLAGAALTVLGFILQWGIRFRLVGITGFLGVITGGLFALGLVPFTHAAIPGAIRYSRVYDNGATKVVIAIPPQITESELDATLRQAAADLFSYGRNGRAENQLKIRARTIIHPESGVSQPLFLGEIRRSLATRNDEHPDIEIYSENFAKLQIPDA